MTTVAIDMNRATPALREAVMRLVAASKLQHRRVHLTTGAASPLGPRGVTFPIVDVPIDEDDPSTSDADRDKMVGDAAAAWVPRDRVAPMQWRVERRLHGKLYANVVDLHAAATGIDTWLVLEGDIMPPISTDPNGGQTPPGDAPIAFRPAKAA